MRTEIVQLHTTHRYFKGDTPEVGNVLGLMSKTLYIGATFENCCVFRYIMFSICFISEPIFSVEGR